MWHIFAPFAEDVCVNILKRGSVPKHVAIVADGARRFGKKHKIPVQENHEIGLFGVMLEVIDWCLLFGVREYSILMYSFGNYYRPKNEVQHWIDIFRVWLVKSIANRRVLNQKGVRFNFYGKLRLIPTEINALMGILTLATENNQKLIVNMVMGYTGRHEMATVSYTLLSAVREGKIRGILTTNLFNECLFAVENHPVDLLIRTSGYKRISDFLSWQTTDAMIYFSNILWPEFSKRDFIKAIFYYQRCSQIPTVERLVSWEDDQVVYVEKLKQKYRCSLMKYCELMGYFSLKANVHELRLRGYETVFGFFDLYRDFVQQ